MATGKLGTCRVIEVERFYDTEQAAREHIASGYYMSSVFPFMVYGRYEDCRRSPGSTAAAGPAGIPVHGPEERNVVGASLGDGAASPALDGLRRDSRR